MPVYEFRCQKCGQKFEELCRWDQVNITCPACGAEDVSRLFSVFGFSTGTSRSTGQACSGCTGGACSTCH